MISITLFTKVASRLETIKRIYSNSENYIERLFTVRRLIEEMYYADIINKDEFKILTDYFNSFVEGELL